ncbi:MAG: A/G-specific adenine glycosylase [Fretibacterium sp.]|nr:A/G-specific adenine glycosylase [Fretibacterium sp.]
MEEQRPLYERASPEELWRYAQLLVRWFRVHARALPWREGGYDPYRVLVSEFMLQQTQVGTVIPYFERWMSRWPDLRSLAAADELEALKLWEGLGYYSRCRNLLGAARALVEAGHDSPPASVEALRACPGIGEYTAGAVASIGHDVPVPAIDGNAERVISRLLAIEEPAGSPALRREVVEAVTFMLQGVSARELNQALMDLGAMVCTPSRGRAPLCGDCPWENGCFAHKMAHEMRFPLPRQRAVVSQENVWGLLALSNAGLLLHHRPAKGLWASMWEVPWFDRKRDFWEDFEAWRASEMFDIQLNGNSLQEIGRANFSFTTHRVRAWVVACDVKDIHLTPAGAWRFFPADELDGLSLPAPSRKFLACLEKSFKIF